MSTIVELVFSEVGSCKTLKSNGFLWKGNVSVVVGLSLDFELSEFDFRLKIFYSIIQYLIEKEVTIIKICLKPPEKCFGDWQPTYE